jgi:hypothetical protein
MKNLLAMLKREAPEVRELSEEEMGALAGRVMDIVCTSNLLPEDSMTLTANALGTMIGVIASSRGEANALQGMIELAQNAIAIFAHRAFSDAETDKISRGGVP